MPNKLPLNWCECKLETVCALDNGLKQNDLNLPLLDAKYLRGKKEAEYRQDGVVLNPRDYVILVDGENSGEIFSIHQIGIMGSTFKKLNFSDSCSVPYVLFFIKSKQDLFRTNKKGAAIPHLDKTLFKNLMLPLPPLAEQERIVEKIETLFADIDNGVERLKSAQAQIKQYRQSVLKSAFCFQNNYFCYLRDCIEKPRYGTSKKCSIDLKNSTPVYRIPNINFLKGIIDKSELKYAVFDDTEKKSLSLLKGDILLIRSNGSLNLVGRAALIHDNDINGLFAGYLIRIRVADYTILNPEFLLYYLNSPKARIYIEEKAKSTSGVNNINSEEISELEIPLPTLPEQQRIVEEIEKRFAVADELEKAVNEGLEKADKLKQSILKKAFAGQLVPQNPNDEPASILLARIKKSQTPTKGKKKC